MSTEQKRLKNSRCDILVATPGRLLDHIENSNLKGQLTKVRVVILDEADRMLDMGFRNELKKIVSVATSRGFQTREA
jgi:ATP-dependent RNA helicase MSS116